MAASKILQPLPYRLRSIYKVSTRIFTRNLNAVSLSATSNKLYNLQNRLFQNRVFCTEENNERKVEEDVSVNVYNGPLSYQMRRIKIFSLSTSLIGICAQPIIYTELTNMQSMSTILFVCSIVGFFTFINPLLLHYVTKKYVTQLDYNRNTANYAATIINFWCVNKKIEFNVDDVVVPDIPGMFTTIIAKGNPMFIDPKFFNNPDHYSKIMGYDKPMDFKLYETSGNKNQKLDK